MEEVATGAGGHAPPDAAQTVAPYRDQDPQEINDLVRTLGEANKAKRKMGFSIKKTSFKVANSPDRIVVDSWRMQDWDYKKGNLPTYARGLFTTRRKDGAHEIAVRGYDKFFNVGEVPETRWENIESRTRGPYELTLKENGCIIFIAGLEDDTLIVCSKHSTGDRSDVEVSHASAGERRLEAQLQRVGKTKQDLARELRKRNVTAVAELCDDTFEEHILAYPPEKAGLYLHGMNVNVPEFMTYPSNLVQKFADDWGFVKTGLILMDDIQSVKEFLEGVAESGSHEGRDVEGFVIRCKESPRPGSIPFHDWFFKYKFEEPYLMYRQWRECTKSMIAGKEPRIKKHQKITEEYLLYAKRRLAADPQLSKLYNQNHGIIQLRDDFLAFKQLKGADAANLDEIENEGRANITRDLVLVPIATIGCGKTTIALALAHLFDFGHVQNDNISGSKRPPRFTAMVLGELETHSAVIADRNNAQKHERNQIITDLKRANPGIRLVALNFVHDDIDEVRHVTQQRVFARGDNHQTIQAATEPNKVVGIMEGFIQRFQPFDAEKSPDDRFDGSIDLDPTAGSRTNLETTVNELHRLYPGLVPTVPSSEELDAAIQVALDGYKPALRHTIPDRSKTAKGGGGGDISQNNPQQQQQKKEKPKQLEYMSIDMPTKEVNAVLEETFKALPAAQARFYRQLQQTRRVQPRFHVTLMHRASAKEHPDIWERYTRLLADAAAAAGASADNVPNAAVGANVLGTCKVQLERVVFDDRLMAIVVRLVDEEDKWTCVNRVSHVTVGTRDDSVKPKESNDVLARWLDEGPTEENRIMDVGIEGRPVLVGTVRGVLSR